MDFESIISSIVEKNLRAASQNDGILEPVGDIFSVFPSTSSDGNIEDSAVRDDDSQACLYQTDSCTKSEPVRSTKYHDTTGYSPFK